jgi:hypothetical protein
MYNLLFDVLGTKQELHQASNFSQFLSMRVGSVSCVELEKLPKALGDLRS